MRLIVKPKQFFLDKKAVIDAIGKERVGALAKGGAYIMRVARRSMKRVKMDDKGHLWDARRKKKTRISKSHPGEPPFSRAGQLRDRLFFAFDPSTKTVVVGPEKLTKKGTGIPEALEHGGTTTDYKKREHKIRAHPFMAPALSNALASGKLPDAWRNVIR